MNRETVTSSVARVRAIEAEVLSLRRTVDEDELGVSDRQYLSRCFELLEMELTALREYLAQIDPNI